MGQAEIPSLSFRLPHGYTFESEFVLPELVADSVILGQTSADASPSAIFLGKLAEFERMRTSVWLDAVGAHAIYVMGKRRSGKTFTLGVIAEGLAAPGWIRQGAATQGVLVLDTLNVYGTMPFPVAEVHGPDSDEMKELRRWHLPETPPPVALFRPRGTPGPPGLDSTEIAVRPADISAEEWCNLFGADAYADPMGHLVTEVHEKVTRQGYTDRGGTAHPAIDDHGIDDLLACLEDDPAIDRYELRTKEAVRRRFGAMSRLSIFSQAGTDLRDLIRAGEISVLLLRDIEQGLRSLLIGIIVKKIMELRSYSDRFERMASVHAARAAITGSAEDSRTAHEYEERAKEGLPRCWVLIDEAHNYIPSRESVPSRPHLRKYINEGRNLGLSIVVATQNPSGLDPAIQRNADILICHSMSMRDDISAAEGMLNTLVPDSVLKDGTDRITGRTFEYLIRGLPQGYAIVSTDQAERVFPIRVRPRITLHGGREY